MGFYWKILFYEIKNYYLIYIYLKKKLIFIYGNY